MSQATPEEVAWAAGLFEGEGCISVYQREYGAKVQPQVRLAMTDEDVVRRFASVVKCGSVSRVHRPSAEARGDKPLFEWRVYEAEKVREVVALLMPYLGIRRTAKAMEVLKRCADVRSHNAKKTHCPRGHSLSGDNLVLEAIKGTSYVARRCKACRAEQARVRKARAA